MFENLGEATAGEGRPWSVNDRGWSNARVYPDSADGPLHDAVGPHARKKAAMARRFFLTGT
ncbi:hypothetical protein ACILG0_20995 [Pseudomonadota bacterium AL_CKDN230030165-1A_HGKHYDSX7]